MEEKLTIYFLDFNATTESKLTLTDKAYETLKETISSDVWKSANLYVNVSHRIFWGF